MSELCIVFHLIENLLFLLAGFWNEYNQQYNESESGQNRLSIKNLRLLLWQGERKYITLPATLGLAGFVLWSGKKLADTSWRHKSSEFFLHFNIPAKT